MYYGHASWVAVVIFAAVFIVRMLSSRSRGRRPGGPLPGSGFTAGPMVPRESPHPESPHPGPDATGPSPTGTAPTGARGTPPGWFTDPFVRHEQRFWSGTAWTEHVSDGGVPSSDPPPGSGGPAAG